MQKEFLIGRTTQRLIMPMLLAKLLSDLNDPMCIRKWLTLRRWLISDSLLSVT